MTRYLVWCPEAGHISTDARSIEARDPEAAVESALAEDIEGASAETEIVYEYIVRDEEKRTDARVSARGTQRVSVHARTLEVIDIEDGAEP